MTWEQEHMLHYFFLAFLALFEVLTMHISSVAQLMLQQHLGIKGFPVTPRTLRQMERKSFSETRVALNAGMERPDLSSWSSLSVPLGNQISQLGTQDNQARVKHGESTRQWSRVSRRAGLTGPCPRQFPLCRSWADLRRTPTLFTESAAEVHSSRKLAIYTRKLKTLNWKAKQLGSIFFWEHTAPTAARHVILSLLL